MKQIHFGTYVTIDGVPDCPAFTFDFDFSAPCNGKQYTLRVPDKGSFYIKYTTTCEDIEVGRGLLDVFNSKDRTEHLFEVQFGHDGTPDIEIWGFSLEELIRGDQRSMSPSAS